MNRIYWGIWIGESSRWSQYVFRTKREARAMLRYYPQDSRAEVREIVDITELATAECGEGAG